MSTVPYLIAHDPHAVKQAVKAGSVVGVENAAVLELSHDTIDVVPSDKHFFVVAQIHLAYT